jgi:dimethylhistidine N-methyltransferase
MSAAPDLLRDPLGESSTARFRADVLRGLSRRPKEIPCKYLYDARGSALFEEICGLAEYYPTRTELGILERHVGEMAALLGPGCLVIEPGSGSGRKTELLVGALADPVGYVPIDISPGPLRSFARRLAAAHPRLEVLPVLADYLDEPALPEPRRAPRRTVVFFPGSTIGNLHPGQAAQFLKRIAAACGRGGALLVGVDLPKDRRTLERAYDDARGVTAAFNLNLLARLNRELDADFDLRRFRHRAVWVEQASRIEMHLVSEAEQTVRVDGVPIHFAAGESICTEHSHKYSLDGFARLARRAGLAVRRVWTDRQRRFSVQYLETAAARG